MTLGDVIKKYRRYNNLSIADFSEVSGISTSYISMLERNVDPRGNAIKPSLETIEKVAKVINMDFDTLIRKISQKVVVNTTADYKDPAVDYLFEDENNSFLMESDERQWDFIKYCYNRASQSEKDKVLTILKVKEKWKEYKEMSNIFQKS